MDSELSRVAINCSVHEFGRSKGSGREGNSLFPSAPALAVKYLQTPNTNIKLKINHRQATAMSSAPAKWMSLIVSHQNRCNLGLDAFH